MDFDEKFGSEEETLQKIYSYKSLPLSLKALDLFVSCHEPFISDCSVKVGNVIRKRMGLIKHSYIRNQLYAACFLFTVDHNISIHWY